MKEYIRQFYYEGIGDLLYAKPKKIIDKKIRNKKVNKVVTLLLKTLYTLFAIICGLLLFYIVYPFK